ncbi:MAG: TlpA family protein disulfide reductase [Pseudomonadales bacterium]
MKNAAALREAPLVFVNYWAIWCGPCREEIPELNKFAREHSDALTVIAINFDGNSGEQLQQEIDEMGITFASIDLQEAEQLGLEKPSVLPTTYVLQSGKLARTLLGPQTLQDLEAALKLTDG